MNIHHLELFYYVARYGGISRAVRHMPYGIQQPAVSSQILLLEQDLGLRLFERSPFQLTREGTELFEFARPFFENLAPLAARLRQGSAPVLRLGAAELILSDYLPRVLESLRINNPKLQLVLRSGFTPQLEAMLLEREIDLAITPVEGRLPPRLRAQSLVSLPLVLLVPKKLPVKSAEELWARGLVEEPLIGLPAREPLMQHFQKGLRRLKVEWPVAIEASSMALLARYVANGYGCGVMLDAPEMVSHPKVRVLPLRGFDPLPLAVLWTGEPSPLVKLVVEECLRYVRARWPEVASRG